MKKRIKILALFGKSASGKDTIQNLLLSEEPEKYHKIVSCTTRPKRDYEVDGVDYHYITKEEFADCMFNNQFIEALVFNGWFYGSRLDALNPDKINIGIFTPHGINCLRETGDEYGLEILPIYIKAPDAVRIFRSLKREQNPNIDELIRRFYTDEEDFAEINYTYHSVYNGSAFTDLADTVETIDNYCKDFFG